jgi:hypothetical protein
MTVNSYVELAVGCETLVEILEQLASAELDENFVGDLEIAENQVEETASRLLDLHNRYDHNKLREVCDALTRLYDPTAAYRLPFEPKRVSVTITPEAAKAPPATGSP